MIKPQMQIKRRNSNKIFSLSFQLHRRHYSFNILLTFNFHISFFIHKILTFTTPISHQRRRRILYTEEWVKLRRKTAAKNVFPFSWMNITKRKQMSNDEWKTRETSRMKFTTCNRMGRSEMERRRCRCRIYIDSECFMNENKERIVLVNSNRRGMMFMRTE